MKGVSVNFEGLLYYVTNEEIMQMEQKVLAGHDAIENRTCPGRSMLGWKDLPENITEEEINKIKAAAQSIRTHSQVLIIAVIKLFDISPEFYIQSNSVIDFMLGPSVVSLGYLLYRHRQSGKILLVSCLL